MGHQSGKKSPESLICKTKNLLLKIIIPKIVAKNDTLQVDTVLRTYDRASELQIPKSSQIEQLE